MSVSGLIEKFRSVALDRVETMNRLVVSLERDASQKTDREALLREAHTLKGEARMLGFADVNLVAHFTEHVLLDAEASSFEVEPEVFAIIFSGLDMIRALLTKTAGSFSGPIDLTGFVERVMATRTGGIQPIATPEPAQTVHESSTGLLKIQPASSLRVELSQLERLGENSAEILLLTRRANYHTNDFRSLVAEFEGFTRDVTPNLPKSQLAKFRQMNHRLESVVGRLREELQQTSSRAMQADDQVRQMRHVSVAEVLSHYPRAIRDLAQLQGKKLRLVHQFGNVQVDRLILSGLSDPLLHLVRNAVDHGIESPEERIAAGKDEEGELFLNVEYAGDAIHVTLRDDGRGMDPAAMRDRAVERGFISREDADALDDGGALALIFQAGFTTRNTVTEMSGRGIGMDVVRREVAVLGGTVEIESKLGEGTTFRLWIPMSSAVSPMLLFVVSKQRFAVPAKDVQRVLMVGDDDIRSTGRGWTVRLGDTSVPVVDFSTVLGLSPRPLKPGTLTLLVFSRGKKRLAAWVDDVVGEREAISRPLGEFLAGVNMCRGMALTDSGEVVPILNLEVALDRVRGPRKRETTRVTAVVGPPSIVKTILVVEDSEVTRTLVSGILRGLGYRILEAEDGSQGVRKLNDHRIDLVLSDVQMPGMSGLDLLEHIRSNPKTKGLPVIMLTTLGSMEDREKALRLGADGYLTKLNFQEKDLIQIVQRYLGV